MSDEVSKALIEKVRPGSSGPAYNLAVMKGSEYWERILAGRDSTDAKKAYDEALGDFLGCRVNITCRKRTLRERLLGLYDTYTRSHKN